ncbi:hypothetical protein [Kitasatospora sp. NPDC004272]
MTTPWTPPGRRSRGRRSATSHEFFEWHEGEPEAFLFDPGEFTGGVGGGYEDRIDEIHRQLPGSRFGLSVTILGAAGISIALGLSATLWSVLPASVALLATGLLVWFHLSERADRRNAPGLS